MNKQLLLLVFAGLSLSAVHAQKPTVILGGEELTVDTLFHAKVGPGTTQTQLHLSGANPLDIYYLTVDRTTPGVSIRTAACTSPAPTATSTTPAARLPTAHRWWELPHIPPP